MNAIIPILQLGKLKCEVVKPLASGLMSSNQRDEMEVCKNPESRHEAAWGTQVTPESSTPCQSLISCVILGLEEMVLHSQCHL